jgi:hypothetical protein
MRGGNGKCGIVRFLFRIGEAVDLRNTRLGGPFAETPGIMLNHSGFLYAFPLRRYMVHALHNEVGPGGPPCAPPYVRRVRISGTLDFLIHSAPDSSLFCDAPPLCASFAVSFFSRVIFLTK